MRIKLRTRIALLLACEIAAVSIALGALYVFDQVNRLKQFEGTFLNDALKDAETLAYVLAPHLLDSNYVLIKNLAANERKHFYRAYVLITDSDNKVLVNSEDISKFEIPAPGTGETAGGGLMQRFQNNGEDYIDISYPIKAGDLTIGAVRLGLTTEWLYEEKKRLIHTIAVFGLAAGGIISLCVLTTLIMANRITKPIIDLKGAAEKISEGDYDQTVSVQRNDEVGMLAQSFNKMVADLRDSQAQLSEAQDELVRKEKLAMLGQIAGNMGNELRNPLGVMSNAVYFLQTVLEGGDESVKEYLGIILNEITRSEHIVEELLAAVRTRSPDLATHGVAELIGQILRQYPIPASVTVTLDIPETISPIRVDALQIQQVLRNLISNGVEAMPEGGTLLISAVENRQDGTVIVSVRDSGSGMTPEVLANLFQPLFTTKARGIGLGLVVAKNLIQANSGRVEVQSEVGKGTVFAITLPSDNSALATA